MEGMNLSLMLLILMVLLAFSAFFSGSETALMSLGRIRLRHLGQTKPKKALLIERILQKPERLISTILLGNNLVNVAMSAIATALAISFWGERGIVYITGIMTGVILIFAEITPKVYAKYFSERVSIITAPTLKIIMAALHPVVMAVTSVSNLLLKLTGVDVSQIRRPLMTEEEIHICISLGHDEGAITDDEKKMLSRVFTLNDRTVREVMVPKERMVALSAESSIEATFKTILKTGHTRFPIEREEDHHIIGFIHVKDLFTLMYQGRTYSLKDIIRPPYFVDSTRTIDEQLRQFQALKLRQAVVLDQKGEVVGLVTLEDILEELVGSIQDEYDL